jgi:hypothetical protein
MGRQRTFDYDEAARLRREGVPVAEIATRFGVASYTIYIATDPARRRRVRKRSRDAGLASRVPCAAGCGRLVYPAVPSSNPNRTGLCLRCSRAARSESVRADTLRCSNCRRWKPDEEFPRRKRAILRRGRHAVCRACSAAVRRRTRDASKVPCVRCCGQPRLPKTPAELRRGRDTGLCKDCYLDSVRLQPTYVVS